LVTLLWNTQARFFTPGVIEIRASQAVQGKTSGKLNIPAVLGYGVKTKAAEVAKIHDLNACYSFLSKIVKHYTVGTFGMLRSRCQTRFNALISS
jgi:hypothetical protein